MKRFLLGLVAALAMIAASAQAQQILIDDVVVGGGQTYLGQPRDIVGGNAALTGVRFFAMDFTPVGGGTLTTCSATVDSVLAPADWVQGNAIASQNCAGRGTASSVSALSADHVRLSVGTTGNGMVRVRLFGCLAQCSAAAGSAVWGSITGTLANQSDLNTALGALTTSIATKAPLASPTFTTSTSVTGPFGSAITDTVASCETAGAPTTLATGGATTDTGLNCLPANSLIKAVVGIVTTTITSACTGWELGDASTAARFSSNNTTLVSGTVTDAAHIGTFNNTGIASATTGQWQASAAKVRITCAGGNPGAGAIRVLVYYTTWQAPTS